jgi:hypothetical protein
MAGCLGRDLNLGPPKYEAGMLTTVPQRLVGSDVKAMTHKALLTP